MMKVSELPIPRLELYWRNNGGYDYDLICEYNLVKQHTTGVVHKIQMGATGSTGELAKRVADGARAVPFRDGVHIAHDSFTLKLPAFIRFEGHDESFPLDALEPRPIDKPEVRDYDTSEFPNLWRDLGRLSQLWDGAPSEEVEELSAVTSADERLIALVDALGEHIATKNGVGKRLHAAYTDARIYLGDLDEPEPEAASETRTREADRCAVRHAVRQEAP